jgi:shikimate kinase
VRLNANRVTKETSTIVDEVLQHLTSQLGVNVEVELDIEASIPHGADPGLVRILSDKR